MNILLKEYKPALIFFVGISLILIPFMNAMHIDDLGGNSMWGFIPMFVGCLFIFFLGVEWGKTSEVIVDGSK